MSSMVPALRVAPLLSIRESLGAAALAAMLATGAIGCEARVSLGSRCTVPGDCPSDLRCIASRCRAECTTERECEDGRRCLRGPDGVNACSTAPDDACTGVEDCGDPLFSRCVAARCQTTCVEDGDCAGGDCVLGGCVERSQLDATEVGVVAHGGSTPTALIVGSFLVPDPDAPDRALTLHYDEGFADVGVVVENEPAGSAWSAHIVTMQRVRIATERLDLGVPTRVDLEFVGTSVSRSAVEVLANFGKGATSVAAEPMAAGGPAYLWMIGVPDDATSPLYPGRFAMFARGAQMPMTMGHDNFTQRFPAQASIARGLGADDDGPGWGLRVVDGARSEYQVVGPMGGAGSEATIPVEASGPVDVEASVRALVLRDETERVSFVRLRGPELLSAASFDLGTGSTCAPGLTDRFVRTPETYVAATCEGATVTLSRIECPRDPLERLQACTITPWLTLTESEPPSRVALETWPGGVVVVSHDTQGVHVRPLSDAADTATAAGSPRFEAVLPPSYRVDADTDFRLLRAASNAASRAGAAIVVVSGLYLDDTGDDDLAQLRLGVLEVSASSP